METIETLIVYKMFKERMAAKARILDRLNEAFVHSENNFSVTLI